MSWYKQAQNKFLDHPNILYHTSMVDDLDRQGISIGMDTINNIQDKSEYIYLGTEEYILDQYLQYTSRPGKYIIYRVNVSNIPLEPLPTGGQWRTLSNIDSTKIVKYKEVETDGNQIDPELLERYREDINP